jgi:hypothetical protein
MNINMKNIELSKQANGWIYIVEEWSDKSNNRIAKGTKLMYANGESLADLEDNFDNLASDNKMTAAEDLLATLSFVTDVAEALAGAKAARIYSIM